MYTYIHIYLQLHAPCHLIVVDGDNKVPCAKGMVHSIGEGLCHCVPVKANFLKGACRSSGKGF